MVPVRDHVARLSLRVSKNLSQVVDGTARYFGRLQRGQPVGFATGFHDRLKNRHQLLAVKHAVAVLRKQRVHTQLRNVGDFAKLDILRVIADGQNEVVFVAVRRGSHFKHLVGHDVLMRVARAPWRCAADQIVGPKVGKHGHLRVKQSHVNLLAFTRFFGMAQRRQNRHRCVHARHQVGHRHTYFLRPTAQIVSLARHTHQPAHALDRVVITCTFSVRPVLPKTSDGAVHHPGVQGF